MVIAKSLLFGIRIPMTHYSISFVEWDSLAIAGTIIT